MSGQYLTITQLEKKLKEAGFEPYVDFTIEDGEIYSSEEVYKYIKTHYPAWADWVDYW